MSKPRVLVVDDKDTILALFRKLLGDSADVHTASDGAQALGYLAASTFDVVVSDIKMPALDGMQLLNEVKREQPDVEVVLMTGYSTVESAVVAMKAGAYDYLTKPFDPDEAAIVVQRAAERRKLRRETRDLRAALEGVERLDRLVTKSHSMLNALRLLKRASNTDATVLVTGESGTGKELAARAVHASSGRSAGPFVAVNCGALPAQLIESELFGHTKGAFTGASSDKRGLFEEAHGGTLFLDELGELPLDLQVKLNRVLQERAVRRVGSADERPIDVRIVAATNVDLKTAIADGLFREDLYFRLNIISVKLPPLRERRDDIPMLAATFLERFSTGRAGAPHSFSGEALARLTAYSWPGNVRELQNVVERAVAVCDGPVINLADLPDDVVAQQGSVRSSAITALSYRAYIDVTVEQASRTYLEALLATADGNVTRAAERAGMQRETMHRLLKRYGIRAERGRAGTQ